MAPRLRSPLSRLADLVAGRRTKFAVFAVLLVAAFAVAGLKAGGFEDAQKNDSISYLPEDAESVQALKAVQQLPGGERAAAIIVYQRDGGLTRADREKIAQDRKSFNNDLPPNTRPFIEPQVSDDGTAALLITSISAAGEDNDFEEVVDTLRTESTPAGGGLEVAVTGPAGFSYDAGKVFEGIGGSLLYAAGGLVFLLLLLIYRSPIFWILPLFGLILAEAATRGLGTLLAESGVTINGQSGGILPVLVFGAGTDYALLLVARYREELRRRDDKHEAMRVALRRAGPAILASGGTVVAGLLCLALAEVNGTAGLGPVGAVGIAVAMLFSLTFLPALLVIAGRRWFWPFIPRVGDESSDETHGFWRAVGDRIARSPRRVWVGTVALLAVCCLGLIQANTDLTRSEIFREDVESVRGQELIAAAFPAGANAPTDVIVPDPSRVGAVTGALQDDPAVASVRPAERGDPGVRLEVILRQAPYSTEAYDQIPRLREKASAAGGEGTLVGGPTAQERDLRDSAARDNKVIIPIVLLVVFVILALLLRAFVAALVLMGTVVLSFAAALGVTSVVSSELFGFPGFDPTLPLLALVFLVALGVDYNIFLMARVREEVQRHGTREGVLRGLAVTGAVITSAGIVLAGTFTMLALPALVFLTQLGFAIAFGVLLDTFLVRSVLVPALSIDIGSRIWWPSALARRGDDSPDAEPSEHPREPAAV